MRSVPQTLVSAMRMAAIMPLAAQRTPRSAISPKADVGLASPATASSSRTLPSGDRLRLSTSHVMISSRRSSFSIRSPKIETRKIASGKSEKRTR